jgi:predicted RNase H-like nuclease (RuvC/YqgF family)
MSSKEQFRDALKSKTRIIASQGKKITELTIENQKLRELNHQLKNQLSGLNKNYHLRKKWWQFWK